ncbi:hypothetical protein [Alteriqipengyuania sp. 357]
MTTPLVLVDNDIVFKLCAYGRQGYLVEESDWAPAHILPVSKFVLRDLAKKSRRIHDRAAVVAAVEVAVEGCAIVQPSEEALAFAAELEEAASDAALELDPGESQLLAILLLEDARWLLTGDKRAVAAIEYLCRDEAKGRIAALEHVLAALLALADANELRCAVCNEPSVDAAATACFACHSPAVDAADVMAGLESYLRALRKIAPSILCETISPEGF